SADYLRPFEISPPALRLRGVPLSYSDRDALVTERRATHARERLHGRIASDDRAVFAACRVPAGDQHDGGTRSPFVAIANRDNANASGRLREGEFESPCACFAYQSRHVMAPLLIAEQVCTTGLKEGCCDHPVRFQW